MEGEIALYRVDEEKCEGYKGDSGWGSGLEN